MGASHFLSHRRAKHQAPSPKLQRSSKSHSSKPQEQMPGQTARRSVFELGACCFFGAWSLKFELFAGLSAIYFSFRCWARRLASNSRLVVFARWSAGSGSVAGPGAG